MVIGKIDEKHWSAAITYRSENIRIIQYVGHETKRWLFMKSNKFDADFDQGKDVSAALDFSKARRTKQEQKRVNVDFPKWMIESLDKEADRVSVTRQSIIKMWLAERLELSASNQISQADGQ